MNKISNFLEHKSNIAGLVLLSILVLNTYNIQENSGKIKHLNSFESGIQTCFTRVNQTYTAKLLADTSSTYLTQNFQNFTEECFAEGILNIEETFKSELLLVTKKMSNLASNVHWFHEDILSPESERSITKNSNSRDTGSRFEKIEITKDEILETSENYKNEIINSLNNEKNVFYISATLLIILLFTEFMKNVRHRFSNNLFEKQAGIELMDSDGTASVKVREIIKSALDQNSLGNCSKLFSNYYASQLLEKKGKNIFSLEGLIAPVGNKNSEVLNKEIDKIWNDDTIGLVSDINENSIEKKMFYNLNLAHINSSVIGLLSEKLFSQGVQIDVKIAENIFISGRQEELEQILYHLINYSINTIDTEHSEKKIAIFAHRLGDIVTFDLIHSGKGFSEEMLKQRAGLISSAQVLDIDLQICETLLAEIQAKFQLDNKLNQKGEIIGGRVKIVFKSGMNISAALTSLKVGSKKDILASFN